MFDPFRVRAIAVGWPFCLLLVVMLPRVAGAEEVGASDPGSQAREVRVVEIATRHLGDKPGESVKATVRVVLPPGYQTAGDRSRFGVLYVFAGLSGTRRGFGPDGGSDYWTRAISSVRILDGLARGPLRLETSRKPEVGGIPKDQAEPGEVEALNCIPADSGWEDFIVVATWNPATLNPPSYSRFRQFIADDLIPYVDRTFRTMPRRDFRVVAGACSGGTVAVGLLMDRPDLFASGIGVQTDVHHYQHSLLPKILQHGRRKAEGAAEPVTLLLSANRLDPNYSEDGSRARREFDATLAALRKAGALGDVTVFSKGVHGFRAYQYQNGHHMMAWSGAMFRKARIRAGMAQIEPTFIREAFACPAVPTPGLP